MCKPAPIVPHTPSPYPTPHLQPVALNLPIPNGVAWRNGALYIGSLDPGKSCRIYRLDNADRYALEKRSATLSDLKVVRGDLPTDRHHGCAVAGRARRQVCDLGRDMQCRVWVTADSL